MKKRVTYRPGKANGIAGVVGGAVFILIGVTIAIPTFGLFGVLWTVMAVAITAVNAYQAFGKQYVGPEIKIEDEKEAGPAAPEEETHDHIPSTALGPQKRLEQLETLKDAGLIDEEEYAEKRKEILREL